MCSKGNLPVTFIFLGFAYIQLEDLAFDCTTENGLAPFAWMQS